MVIFIFFVFFCKFYKNKNKLSDNIFYSFANFTKIKINC
uniref:Uncharacterized protein n=1 Tax=viral metagenome TaxID=1070528 RepID=A0A6C0H604_9ZZZZ